VAATGENELTKFLQCHDDLDESSLNVYTDAILHTVVVRGSAHLLLKT